MTLSPALAPSTGCRLVSTDGRALPLRSVEVSADAGGGLARVRLRQVFANAYAEPLAVTYQLPLPADGAVVALAFVLAGKRVVGRVERKSDARAAFEQAVLEGRTATLLEQERSSLFTQEIGNLPPGAEVEIELDVEQPLAWEDGGWIWRWPTVVGPRYLGAPGETPDAEKVTVDVAAAVPARCSAFVRVADALTGAPTSPSHELRTGEAGIALEGALDRDLVVRWPVAAQKPGVRLEVARPAGDPSAYGLLTLVPPAIAGKPVARDLCLLLDTSGSMGGAPLAQGVAFATGLVEGLRTGDRLEMIAFSSAARRWRPEPVLVDAAARAAAVRWLKALRAGGGTAMHEAVTEALRPLRPDAERQVVLVTDGYIGFESEVVGRIRRGLPPGSRIHSVGIGSSVNRTLTSGVARAGGGHEAIVGPEEPVASAVAALLARTGDPLWVDVRIAGSALVEQAPAAVPDLLAGSPARIALRLRPEGGTLVVTARTAAGPVVHELAVAPVAPAEGRAVVATRFARERVEDFELARSTGEAVDAAIEALGLRHHLATRLTSWVAVSDDTTVDPSDPTRRVRMPHLLPHGVSAEGVGLRAAGPMPPPPPAPVMAQAMPAARQAPGAPPPPPSPAPERAKKVMKEEAVDLLRAAPAAPAEEVAGLRRKLVVKARRAVLPDGRVVYTFEAPEEVAWDPEALVVVGADGSRVKVTPVVGTTRAGAVPAGSTIRVVFGPHDPAAARLEGRDLVVEIG